MSEQRRDTIAVDATTLDGRKFSPVTRAGIFVYHNDDGTPRRELRRPEDVFAPESLASLSQVPVTLGHPDDFVTDETWQALAVGTTGDSVRRDGEFVTTPLKVIRRDAKAAIKGGIRELSCGYEFARLDMSPGIWNGEAYDAIQVGPFDYNHVAIVAQGRAGERVRYMDGKFSDKPAGEVEHTVKIRIDGKDVEVADDVGLAFARLQGRADAAAEFIEKMKAKKKEADDDGDEPDGDEGMAADAKKKNDAADKIRADAETATRARVALETKLTPHVGDKYRFDGKKDAEIRKDALGKLCPELDLTGKDDAYVAARLDIALDGEQARTDAAHANYKGIVQPLTGGHSRIDAAHDDYEKTVKARMDREAGKTAEA